MTNLIIILSVLFAALFVIVQLSQRFSAPIETEKMNKLSRIAMILIALMFLLRGLQYFIGF